MRNYLDVNAYLNRFNINLQTTILTTLRSSSGTLVKRDQTGTDKSVYFMAVLVITIQKQLSS